MTLCHNRAQPTKQSADIKDDTSCVAVPYVLNPWFWWNLMQETHWHFMTLILSFHLPTIKTHKKWFQNKIHTARKHNIKLLQWIYLILLMKAFKSVIRFVTFYTAGPKHCSTVPAWKTERLQRSMWADSATGLCSRSREPCGTYTVSSQAPKVTRSKSVRR